MFLWVHYIDPHQYMPPPGYAEPFLEDDLFQSKRVPVNPGRVTYKGISSKLFEKTGNVDDVGVHIASYDGEIRYLDEHLDRLFKGMGDGYLTGTLDPDRTKVGVKFIFHLGRPMPEPIPKIGTR